MRERNVFDRDFAKTGVQPSLDRMTLHCAKEFGCSIALITILDETEQFLVSRFGTDLERTPRNISFCRYVVDGDDDLLVEDARDDVRFANNPFVLGEPKIRSYAGCAIKNAAGQRIGTLCLIDQSPKKFSTETLEVLRRHALGVSDMIRLHETHIQSVALASELQNKNDLLRSANRVFQQAERVARIGSWELEVESGELYWSDEVYRIHGLEPGEEITVEKAIDLYSESYRSIVQEHVEKALNKFEPFEFEAILETRDGSFKPVHSTGEYLPGDLEHPARLVGVIRDISSQYEAQSALEHAANHDSLTGLFNRHAFDRQLQHRLNQHNQADRDVVLLLLDLDGFKDVNDTFGHVTGDIILEEVANRIRSAELNESLVARWGGDEFVVVLPLGTSIERAVEYGNAVLKKIRSDTVIGGRVIAMNATCGLAKSEKHVSARELIRRADTALYHGKLRDQGGVTVYDSQMETANRERRRAISEVKSALRNDRLFAGYQPVVDLLTREVVGFEALLRLYSRDDHILTASEVLPALIDPTISRQISRKMTEFVACEVNQILLCYPDLRFISLNATEGDLLSPNFAETFLASLKSKGVDFSRIALEVTETMLLVNDPEAVRAVLKSLKAAGIKIALDDFGTGFSSLSHLRDFPIDKVKIDQSFVRSMTTKHDARLIVQAIIGMAKSLGIRVLAEGVETEEQHNLLLQMGCPVGQGFLFSPALDIDQLSLQSVRNRVRNGARRKVA